MEQKYVVSLIVTVAVSLEVEAESVSEAATKAEHLDLSDYASHSHASVFHSRKATAVISIRT